MSDSETQTQGAMEAPPGVAPDFVHPYSLEDYILATQIFFLVVVAICVLMRMYTCLFIIRRFGVEECMCLELNSFELTRTSCRCLPSFLGELSPEYVW